MIQHRTTWKTSAAERLLAKYCDQVPTVARYTLDVIRGDIPTGRLVFLAAERFLNDLQRAAAKDPEFPYHFDQGCAVSLIKFFRDLAPFRLMPFQQFIGANIFGWIKNNSECDVHPLGHRRFQTAYIEMGKGNGKTPFAAGIGVYGVCGDGEPKAEVYCAAPSKKQAAICFRDAVDIVEKSEELKAEFKQYGCAGEMLSGNLSFGVSFMKPISAEHKTLDGPRPSTIVGDELHEHKNPLVMDKLTAGFKARHQPLDFEITNSGFNRDTICFAHHDYTRQVLERVNDNEQWFGYVCQLDVCAKCRTDGKEVPTCDDCDSWLDRDVWVKANPGLGVILLVDYLEKQVKEGLEIPTQRNLVQRLNFCMWTQSEERFISPEAWRVASWETAPAEA